MSEQETWTSSIRMLTGLPGTVSYEVIGTDPSDRNQIFAAESQSEAKRLAEFLNDLHGALRDVVELNDNLLKRDEERTQAIAERDAELTRLREYKALADKALRSSGWPHEYERDIHKSMCRACGLLTTLDALEEQA